MPEAAERLFTRPSAIWVSFLEPCLSKSSAHFLTGSLVSSCSALRGLYIFRIQVLC